MAKIMKIAETLFLVFALVFLDISVKLLLKQPLYNCTHLFIKAHSKSRAFFNIQAGGGQMPTVVFPIVPPPPLNHIYPLSLFNKIDLNCYVFFATK